MNERRSEEMKAGRERRRNGWREIRSVRVRQRGGEALMERLTTEEDEKKHSRKRGKEPGGSEGGRRQTETSRRRNKSQDVRKKRRRIRGGEGRDWSGEESDVSDRCTRLLCQNVDKHLVMIIIIMIMIMYSYQQKHSPVCRMLSQQLTSANHRHLLPNVSRHLHITHLLATCCSCRWSCRRSCRWSCRWRWWRPTKVQVTLLDILTVRTPAGPKLCCFSNPKSKRSINTALSRERTKIQPKQNIKNHPTHSVNI